MSIGTIRTNIGNAGWIKLRKEDSYGNFRPPPGSEYPSIVYNAGGHSFNDARETVPRRGIAGLGPMEMVQLRDRAEGSIIFDQEMDGHAPLLLGLFGGVATEGTGPPYDNFFWSIGSLPSFNLIDVWPSDTGPPPAGNYSYSYGVMMNSLALTMEGGNPLTAEYGFLAARTAIPASSTPVLDNYKYIPAKPQNFVRVEWMGLDLTAAFHSFTLTITNNLRDDVYPVGLSFAGSPGRQYAARGDGGMTVEFTAEMYADENYFNTSGFSGLYADFIVDNPAAPLILQIDTPATATTNRMVIYVPSMKVTGETLNVNSHGAQVATVTGMAHVGTVPFTSSTDFPLLGDGNQVSDQSNQLIGVQYSSLENAAALD